MKSIAGSIVVLGACVLLSSSVHQTADRGTTAMAVAGVVLVLGLIVTFTGSRDDR